MASKFIIHV